MLGYNRCCLVNTMIVSPLAGPGKLIGEEGGENTSRLSLSVAKVAAWVAKTGCEAGRGRAIWILAARGSGDWEESHPETERLHSDPRQTRHQTPSPPPPEFTETQYIFMQII